MKNARHRVRDAKISHGSPVFVGFATRFDSGNGCEMAKKMKGTGRNGRAPISIAEVRMRLEDSAYDRLESCEPSPEREAILETAVASLEGLATNVLIALIPVFARHVGRAMEQEESRGPDSPDGLAG